MAKQRGDTPVVTPFQYKIIEHLAEQEGELRSLKQLGDTFFDAEADAPDHRLAESLWGLIEIGMVFEPEKQRAHYHLTDEAIRRFRIGDIAIKEDDDDGRPKPPRRMDEVTRKSTAPSKPAPTAPPAPASKPAAKPAPKAPAQPATRPAAKKPTPPLPAPPSRNRQAAAKPAQLVVSDDGGDPANEGNDPR